MQDAWNPARYGRFTDERSRPFYDLLSLVNAPLSPRILDLGCGAGTLTRHLHLKLDAKQTLGIDTSAAMLDRAKPLEIPGLSFRNADAATFEESGWDLVFSNAALHWVDDHRALFARLAKLLSPGGVLAVQMPANHTQPSHVEAQRCAGEEPFQSELGGWTRQAPVLELEDYALLLRSLGLKQLHLRVEVYVHELASRDDVVEWTRGALLTAYEQRLPPELYASFLERYRQRLHRVLEDVRPFPLTYRRLFLVARKQPR